MVKSKMCIRDSDEIIAVENDDALATGRLIGHKEGCLLYTSYENPIEIAQTR